MAACRLRLCGCSLCSGDHRQRPPPPPPAPDSRGRGLGERLASGTGTFHLGSGVGDLLMELWQACSACSTLSSEAQRLGGAVRRGGAKLRGLLSTTEGRAGVGGGRAGAEGTSGGSSASGTGSSPHSSRVDPFPFCSWALCHWISLRRLVAKRSLRRRMWAERCWAELLFLEAAWPPSTSFPSSVMGSVPGAALRLGAEVTGGDSERDRADSAEALLGLSSAALLVWLGEQDLAPSPGTG